MKHDIPASKDASGKANTVLSSMLEPRPAVHDQDQVGAVHNAGSAAYPIVALQVEPAAAASKLPAWQPRHVITTAVYLGPKVAFQAD
jgi:hypothetical protein